MRVASVASASVSGGARSSRTTSTKACASCRNASALYVAGFRRLDSATGSARPDENETDVRADCAVGRGTILEGLVAAFQYAWLHQDGAPQTQTRLRAILNDAFRFCPRARKACFEG
jgi:hypothetical protein